MAEFKQTNRFLYLDTPLGPDQLLLKSFDGQEGISQLFRFRLDCEAENATAVDFDKLIGQKVSFGIKGEEGQTPRDFDGIVVEMAQVHRDQFFTRFEMTVVPSLWKLTKTFRNRMFQQTTIPDILKKVLQGLDVAYEIQGTFEPREYCLQYQETDYDFFSRLMEEEGIFYFFKFTRGSHKLVLANTPQSHVDIPGDSKLIFEVVEGGLRDEERISSWHKLQAWGSGKWTLMDHHFQLPHKKLEAEKTVLETVQVGKVTHKLKLNGNENFEVYENPGRYAQRFDGIDKAGGEKPGDLQKIFQDNKRVTGIRMQHTETPMILITGEGNCRQMTSGHKFTLQRHFNADGVYVITEVSHDADEPSFRSDNEPEATAESHYSNEFSCIPVALPFRPPRITKRPYIPGSQSAVVVGPSGEEIFTDKYGRIKVQFHWDRDGKNNVESSCWLRVASPWAGKEWGMISLPRIGQEVIVMFLEGDPDRPIVMGSVYNPDQMPPYELPKHKTVATWRSRSSKGGGKTNFNEIRFEDLKDDEQMFIHAERDRDDRTKHDAREWVGNDKSKIVKKNEKELIEGTKSTTIGGDHIVLIKHHRKEAVEGDQEFKLTGNFQEKVGGRVAQEASGEIHIKSGTKIIIEAGAQISLKGPGGFIDISAMGVVIQGTMVLINSGGAAGSGSGSNPNPPDPAAPDVADDGTKFHKM